MSRAEEINKLVDFITSRPFITVSTGMDGLSIRREVGVSLLVNKSLLLYNLWDRFSAKNKEVEKIDVSTHRQWAKLEISGYRSFDFNAQDGKMKELCSCRAVNGGWIRYSIAELELAHNSNQRLLLKEGAYILPRDILPIIKNVYSEVQVMASEIGKEIDIKMENPLGGPYDFTSLGHDDSENNYDANDEDYDPTGGAFSGGDY